MINFFPRDGTSLPVASPARAFIRLSSDARCSAGNGSKPASANHDIHHAPITHLWPAAVLRNSAIGTGKLLREQRPVRASNPLFASTENLAATYEFSNGFSWLHPWRRTN